MPPTMAFIYVWVYENGVENLNSRLKRAFFFARNYLQSPRYKNYKQSQCFFPSSACLSSFRYPPFSTICRFLGPKEGLKVQWNQALGCSSLTPFSKIQTYIVKNYFTEPKVLWAIRSNDRAPAYHPRGTGIDTWILEQSLFYWPMLSFSSL